MNTTTAATVAQKLVTERIDSEAWHRASSIGEILAVLAKSKRVENKKLHDILQARFDAHFEFHCANVLHTPTHLTF